MPFQYILANLLAACPDAVAVMFLDDAGETVDLATSEYQPFDLQVVGAYLGIYLRQMQAALDTSAIGAPEAMQIEHHNLNIHLRTLPDGYYLALVQRKDGLAGRARYQVEHAARALVAELFP